MQSKRQINGWETIPGEKGGHRPVSGRIARGMG